MMTELLQQIRVLIADAAENLDQIENTLTDGYAHALSLEAEGLRLERRMTELAQGIQRGDTAKKARELSELARRIDANGDELTRLRSLLGDLRRHADDVRVGSPSR
jgi:ABC-type phosphate transport system auxiliary subunit